jgi:dihydropteroate synthase
VQEVHDFLCLQTLKLFDAGVASERMILDVGFGFGKTLAHNTALFNNLGQFKALNYEVFAKRFSEKNQPASVFNPDALQELIHQKPSYLNLVGISNKTMVGDITAKSIDQRQAGNDALHLLALQKGADILRVHDVGSAIDVLKIHQHFAK